MEGPGLRQRLTRGARAQAVNFGVRFAIQVAMVSLLVAAWGLDLFGEWLILAAVPLYLAVSDVGLLAAGSNAMIMQVAAGDRDNALATFRAVSVAVFAAFIVAIVLMFAFAAGVPLTSWFNLDILSEQTAALIIVALGLNTLVAAYETVLSGGFASEGHYGEGIFAIAMVDLVTFLALAVVVVLGAGPGVAAVALLVGRLAGTVVMYHAMRRYAPWIRLGRTSGIRATLGPLVSPGLASGAFPAALAVNVQGMVILIGVVAGPVMAAIFSTLRTMSRIIVQVLTGVFMVIAPEISKAFAEGNVPRLRSLHRHGCQAAVWIAAPIIAFLAVFGDPIIQFWTSGEVSADGLLLYLFLAVVGLNALWMTSLSVIFATNRHQRLGVYFIVASVAILPLAYVLLEAWGLEGAAASLVVLEAFMLVVTVRQSLTATDDHLRGWLGQALRPPPLAELAGLLRSRRASGGAPAAAPVSGGPPSGEAPPV